MDEERSHEERALQMYEQRVTKVEETVRYISVEQQRQWSTIEKITLALEAITNRIGSNELAEVAIRERTEQHSKNIEHLQEGQIDIGKLLNKHDNDIEKLKSFGNSAWDTFKWFAVTAGSLAAGYAFSHFVK